MATPLWREEIAVARHAVGGLEALDEALDDAGGGPQRDRGRRTISSEIGRAPVTRNCCTTRSSEPGGTIFEERSSSVAETNSARVCTRMVAAEVSTGKKREQRRIGGGLCVAEAPVVKGGEEALAKQPRQVPESHPHTASIPRGAGGRARKLISRGDAGDPKIERRRIGPARREARSAKRCSFPEGFEASGITSGEWR